MESKEDAYYLFKIAMARFDEAVHGKSLDECEVAKIQLEWAGNIYLHLIKDDAECEKKLKEARKQMVNRLINQTNDLCGELITGLQLESILRMADKTRVHKLSLIGQNLEMIQGWIIKQRKETRRTPPENIEYKKLYEKAMIVQSHFA